MAALDRPIRQAQHRLWLNRWLGTLGWSLAGAAGLFAAGVVLDRLWLAPIGVEHWFGWFALAVGGLALGASVVWAAATRENPSTAAARLDLAAGLKERLSTGLHCQGSPDPFARAVVADATRLGASIRVPRHLPVAVPRAARYAGGAWLVAVLVFLLLPTLDLAGHQARRQEEGERAHRVERAQAAVVPKLEQQIEKLQTKHPNMSKELGELEPMNAARLDTPLDVRREGIKQIEQIKQKLEQQRAAGELAQVDEFKKLLHRLSSASQSATPVGQLTKALAQGDFKAAQEAIAALQLELSKAPGTEEEKQRAQELKDQVKQLSDKLGKIAQDDKKLRDQLAEAGLNQEQIKRALEHLSKKDFEQLKKELAEKGLSAEQIEKLAQQMMKRCSACGMASKLSQSLAEAAGAQGAGQDGQSGTQGLTAAGEQLSEAEDLEQQLNDLVASLSDLERLQGDVGNACSLCNGTGMADGHPCSACQGSGSGLGQEEQRGPGMGALGQGEGGVAPEQVTDFKTVRKKADVHTGPGRIISQQFVDGEQLKGEVSPDFVEAALSAEREVSDAISEGRTPRVYHGAIKKYFTHTRADLPADKAGAAPEKPDGGEQ